MSYATHFDGRPIHHNGEPRPAASGLARTPSGAARLLDGETERERRQYTVLLALPEYLPPTLATVRDVAQTLQATAIPDGSVQPQYGFGEWGVEFGVRIVTTTTEHDAVRRAVRWLLVAYGQECAYVEVDGKPYEWAADGSTSPIVGHL